MHGSSFWPVSLPADPHPGGGPNTRRAPGSPAAHIPLSEAASTTWRPQLPRMEVWTKAWWTGSGPECAAIPSAAGNHTRRERLPIGPRSCPGGHRLHPHRTRLRRRQPAKHPKRPVTDTIVPPPVRIPIVGTGNENPGDGARSGSGRRGGNTRGGPGPLPNTIPR
jgi:hypothetical protein